MYQALFLISTIIILPSCSFFQKKEEAITKTEISEQANKQPSQFTVPLIKAASQGDIQKIIQLLNEKIPVDIRDEKIDNMTALMVAANLGYKNIVEQLLNAKANVNVADKFGRTPLMFAISAGHNEIVKELIDKGADITAHEIDPLFGRHENERSVFMFAVWNNNTQIVDLLLKMNLPKEQINQFYRVGSYEMTPLMYAADHGFAEIVTMLLKIGTPINKQNNQGNTALMYAADGIITVTQPWGYQFVPADESSINKTVEILLKNDADILMQNNDGRTALHAAAIGGQIEVIKAFINVARKKQIPVKNFISMTDKQGKTALDLAKMRLQEIQEMSKEPQITANPEHLKNIKKGIQTYKKIISMLYNAG